MNVEEKSKFLKKRIKIIKEMDEASGIPLHKLDELHDLGILPNDLKDMPLCQVKQLLNNHGRSKSIDPNFVKA